MTFPQLPQSLENQKLIGQPQSAIERVRSLASSGKSPASGRKGPTPPPISRRRPERERESPESSPCEQSRAKRLRFSRLCDEPAKESLAPTKDTAKVTAKNDISAVAEFNDKDGSGKDGSGEDGGVKRVRGEERKSKNRVEAKGAGTERSGQLGNGSSTAGRRRGRERGDSQSRSEPKSSGGSSPSQGAGRKSGGGKTSSREGDAEEGSGDSEEDRRRRQSAENLRKSEMGSCVSKKESVVRKESGNAVGRTGDLNPNKNARPNLAGSSLKAAQNQPNKDSHSNTASANGNGSANGSASVGGRGSEASDPSVVGSTGVSSGKGPTDEGLASLMGSAPMSFESTDDSAQATNSVSKRNDNGNVSGNGNDNEVLKTSTARTGYGDEGGGKLFHKSRRRLSLVHAEPISEEDEASARGERGTAMVDLHTRETLEAMMAKTTEAVRLSISGQAAAKTQRDFENKSEVVKGSAAFLDLSHSGVGHACKKGLKPESPNQDDFFLFRFTDWGLYGVFDGHGPAGHHISNFVQQKLANLIWQHKKFERDPVEALKEAFADQQRAIHAAYEAGKFDATLSGCTATVVVHDVRNHRLYAAHLGDSRAVIAGKVGAAGEGGGPSVSVLTGSTSAGSQGGGSQGRGSQGGGSQGGGSQGGGSQGGGSQKGGSTAASASETKIESKTVSVGGGTWIVENLTIDHKPTLAMEKARIERCGGEVKKLEGDIPHRVFLKGKPYPGLAMSRAFGDIIATEAGVTSVPEISHCSLEPGKEYLLLICSDGVWEFISNCEAVATIVRHPVHKVQAATEALAIDSWNRWIGEEGDVVDDITVEAIYLNHSVNTH